MGSASQMLRTSNPSHSDAPMSRRRVWLPAGQTSVASLDLGLDLGTHVRLVAGDTRVFEVQ